MYNLHIDTLPRAAAVYNTPTRILKHLKQNRLNNHSKTIVIS